MYICLDCHREFDEPEMKYGFGGYPEEPTWHCPYCDSMDYEETEECAECGAVKFKDNLISGMCEDCINEAAEDMRLAYEYGAYRTDEVELNGVLATAFSKVQIEAILTNYLMNNGDFAAECKRFALDDEYDFADWLVRRKKK